MSGSKTRADELLDRWTNATARPVPAFTPRTRGGHPLRLAAVVALSGLLVIAALGAIAVGGTAKPTQISHPSQAPASPAGLVTSPDASVLATASPAPSDEPLASPGGSGALSTSPAKLAASAAKALASTPGIRYALKVNIEYPNFPQHLDSSGEIDFEHHRFSGLADGEGNTMPLFGGPTSGGVVVADGLYVRSDVGEWERIADPKSPIDRLVDRSTLSDAIARWVAASKVDPVTRTGPCVTYPCRIVQLDVPKAALSELFAYLFGQEPTTLPNDMDPIIVDLHLDASGFPVRMVTEVTAGSTTTTVTLELARLDPAPTIAPPIP